MSTAIKVLGICGSLCQASHNAAALHAAQATGAKLLAALADWTQQLKPGS